MMCNSEHWQHQILHCDGIPVILIYGSSVLPFQVHRNLTALQMHRNLLPLQVHKNQDDGLALTVVL